MPAPAPAPIPASTVENGGVNVPVIQAGFPHEAEFHTTAGALRYDVTLDERAVAQTLLITKDSPTLVVALHGMMVPGHHHLPRFEWLRSLQQTDHSCLYLSDPTLQADPGLRLAWYLGWEDLDLYPILAGLVRKAAEAAGARNIVFTGSSGGGYAALQLSAHLPESIAVAFNAQTSVGKYHWKHQARYVRRVMPHLLSGKKRRTWASALGMRTNALTRYCYARNNLLLCVQNTNDPHHLNEHYVPFKELIESGPNQGRARFETYDGPSAHEPPSRGRFRDTIATAVGLLEHFREHGALPAQPEDAARDIPDREHPTHALAS